MTHDATVCELPLLIQAELGVTAARDAENTARRLWAADLSNEALRAAYTAAQGAHRRAQSQLDRTRHGLQQVQNALPDARRALVRAESELASEIQVARRRIAMKEREVAQARAEVESLVNHLTAMMGPDAVAMEG
jgi:hypothetical protein